jgi:hypothetical protein
MPVGTVCSFSTILKFRSKLTFVLYISYCNTYVNHTMIKALLPLYNIENE